MQSYEPQLRQEAAQSYQQQPAARHSMSSLQYSHQELLHNKQQQTQDSRLDMLKRENLELKTHISFIWSANDQSEQMRAMLESGRTERQRLSGMLESQRTEVGILTDALKQLQAVVDSSRLEKHSLEMEVLDLKVELEGQIGVTVELKSQLQRERKRAGDAEDVAEELKKDFESRIVEVKCLEEQVAQLDDSRVDPNTFDNIAIRMAANMGHTDIVRQLMWDPRVDPLVEHNFAFRKAAEGGHLEIVNVFNCRCRCFSWIHESILLRKTITH
jgi:chromosome segregation ATPase